MYDLCRVKYLLKRLERL